VLVSVETDHYPQHVVSKSCRIHELWNCTLPQAIHIQTVFIVTDISVVNKIKYGSEWSEDC